VDEDPELVFRLVRIIGRMRTQSCRGEPGMRRVNLLTWHQLHPIDVHLTTASSHGLPSTCTSGSLLLVRTMKLTPRIMNLLRSIDLFAWNNDGGGGTSESNGDTKGRRSGMGVRSGGVCSRLGAGGEGGTGVGEGGSNLVTSHGPRSFDLI
jgi:hypothetical protein